MALELWKRLCFVTYLNNSVAFTFRCRFVWILSGKTGLSQHAAPKFLAKVTRKDSKTKTVLKSWTKLSSTDSIYGIFAQAHNEFLNNFISGGVLCVYKVSIEILFHIRTYNKLQSTVQHLEKNPRVRLLVYLETVEIF